MATFEYGPTPEQSMRYIDYGGFNRRLLWRAVLESMKQPRRSAASSRWLIWRTFGW